METSRPLQNTCFDYMISRINKEYYCYEKVREMAQ